MLHLRILQQHQHPAVVNSLSSVVHHHRQQRQDQRRKAVQQYSQRVVAAVMLTSILLRSPLLDIKHARTDTFAGRLERSLRAAQAAMTVRD